MLRTTIYASREEIGSAVTALVHPNPWCRFMARVWLHHHETEATHYFLAKEREYCEYPEQPAALQFILAICRFGSVTYPVATITIGLGFTFVLPVSGSTNLMIAGRSVLFRNAVIGWGRKPIRPLSAGKTSF
jgi:hypothetical protein